MTKRKNPNNKQTFQIPSSLSFKERLRERRPLEKVKDEFQQQSISESAGNGSGCL